MLGALISKVRKSELADAPQTLKLRRVDKPYKQPAVFRSGVETDNVVDRVSVNSFFQKITPYRRRFRSILTESPVSVRLQKIKHYPY